MNVTRPFPVRRRLHRWVYARSAPLVVAALGAFAASGAQALTVQNGSFEEPALGFGLASGTGSDWVLTGSAFVITDAYGLGTTEYGNQWLYLNGNNSTDSQVLSGGFTPGTTYVASLAATTYFGNLGGLLTMKVEGGGMASPAVQVFQLPSVSNFGGSPIEFQSYALSFTPTTNAALTLSFTNSSPNDVLAIDNVTISPAPVPEPGTLALALAGAALLLPYLRSKSKAA